MSFLFDVVADIYPEVEFREPLKSMLECDQVLLMAHGVMFPSEDYWKIDGHIDVELTEKIRMMMNLIPNYED